MHARECYRDINLNTPYLPKFKEGPNMKDSEIYFNFMLHMAAADGQIDDEELTYLDTCIESLGVSDDVYQNLKGQLLNLKNNGHLNPLDDTLAILSSSNNPSLAMTIFRDAFALANIDDDLDTKEQALLEKFAYSFGATGQNFKRLMSWANRAINIKEEGEYLFEQLAGKQ